MHCKHVNSPRGASSRLIPITGVVHLGSWVELAGGTYARSVLTILTPHVQ